MPCVYSSRKFKNYRICPIRIEIMHGRHRVVQNYTWAGPLYFWISPLALNRNESGRFGALKSVSTHHFFRNACTKSGSLRFHSFPVVD